MIDTTRKYATRDGREVVIHEIERHNSLGAEVTFPVKGTIIETMPSGRKRRDFNIWTLDGRDGIWGESPKDIIDLGGAA